MSCVNRGILSATYWDVHNVQSLIVYYVSSWILCGWKEGCRDKNKKELKKIRFCVFIHKIFKREH